jgi:hypothetical protein
MADDTTEVKPLRPEDYLRFGLFIYISTSKHLLTSKRSVLRYIACSAELFVNLLKFGAAAAVRMLL